MDFYYFRKKLFVKWTLLISRASSVTASLTRFSIEPWPGIGRLRRIISFMRCGVNDPDRWFFLRTDCRLTMSRAVMGVIMLVLLILDVVKKLRLCHDVTDDHAFAYTSP